MMKYYIIVICSVLLSAVAQLLLKSSSGESHGSFLREYLNWKVMLGYGMMGVAMLANIFAMSRGVLAKEVSSIEALSYLFVPLLSFLVFKETLTRRKILSIIVIITGVVIFFQ